MKVLYANQYGLRFVQPSASTTALPQSMVLGLAAEIARAQPLAPPARASIAATMPRAASVSPRCSSIMAPDQICADRIGDALAGDVGRRAVHRLEQRREFALGVDVAGRRDADGAGAGRAEVGQDVAEQVGRDDHVEAVGMQHELGGEDVDVVLVPLARPDSSSPSRRRARPSTAW